MCIITFDPHENLVGQGGDNGMISMFIDKNEPQRGTKSPSEQDSHDQTKPSHPQARPFSTTQVPCVLFVPGALGTQQLLFPLWIKTPRLVSSVVRMQYELQLPSY